MTAIVPINIIGGIEIIWDNIPAGEYCLKVADGTHDSPKESKEGKLLITSKNIREGVLDKTSAYKISENDFNEANKRSKVDKWDLLLSMIGTVGEVCLVMEEPDFAIKNVGLFKCSDEVKAKWLYYFLRSAPGKNHLLSRLSGTTQKYITLGELRDFPIPLPSPHEMEAIVRILSSLDDKIELLRKQNETLEKTAQAIYHERFGRYSVDDELPEEWRIGSFTDRITILAGGTPSTTNESYWNGEIPWFSVVDCPGSGPFVFETKKSITHSGLENSAARILPVGTTILTARGTVGKTALVGREMAMNQSCFGLKSNGGHDYFTYFDTLNILEVLKSRVHGAVFDTITRDTLSSIETVIPNEDSVRSFESTVRPLFERMKVVTAEIKTLSETRDALLPRLLSGEIRINQ